jgi:glycosyltransferase involved in cell wall biosynthesis
MNDTKKVTLRSLIVLGMHRSGTSALMRVLNLCGVDLGSKLVPADPEINAKGYWEHADINQLNDKLLEDLNSSWDDVRYLPENWWNTDIAQRYELEILNILERDFGNCGLWGIKDSRICRFLPLWQSILKQTGSKPYFLIIVRNPLEVVASLAKRDGFPKGKSGLLWLKHLIESEKGTRKSTRMFVTYEELLADWMGLMKRVQTTFRIKWPVALNKVSPAVEDFLDINLRHHRLADTSLIEDKTIAKWIRDAYIAIKETIDGDDKRLVQAIDVIETELKESVGLYEPVLTDLWKKQGANYLEIQKLDAELAGLREKLSHAQVNLTKSESEITQLRTFIEAKDQKINRLNRDSTRFQDEINLLHEQVNAYKLEREALLKSTSWKLTAPLRWISLKAGKFKKKIKPALYVFNGQYRLIKKSRRFDTSYYLEKNADVAASGMNPLVHYLEFGAKEGTDPNSAFDTASYLEKNPDLADKEINPLTHYLKFKRQSVPANGFTSISGAQDILYEHADKATSFETDIKMIAFYLPQFHPIPENDAWWGEGFTEWRNVSKAKPQFAGHYQPKFPGELGYYDLRVVDVQRRQIEMARKNGLYGFCYYYYWFNGKRLLERPLEQFLLNRELTFPFCICWANENWTRRWDGLENEVLIGQDHSPQEDLTFIKNIEPILGDSRYIRINDKPLLVIYRPDLFPDSLATTARWREYCVKAGVGELYLAMIQTNFGEIDPRKAGYDAAIQFPPHRISVKKVRHQVPHLSPEFSGLIYSYPHLIETEQKKEVPPYKWFRGIMPGWDSTARIGHQSHLAYGSTPQLYEKWLSHLCEYTRKNLFTEERFIFVNAWNEWAEGTYLEPDDRFGYAFLNKTAAILSSFPKPAHQAGKWKILFVSHDACRGGAQSVLINVISWFKKHTYVDLKILCIEGGQWLGRFKELGDTVLLSQLSRKERSQAKLIQKILDFCRGKPDLVYGNTVAAGRAFGLLHKLNAPIITHFHELEMSTHKYAADCSGDVFKHSSHFVACSTAVRDNLAENFNVDAAMIATVHASIKPDNTIKPLQDGEKRQIRKKLRLKEKETLIFGCGFGMVFRKGGDLFIEVARILRSKGRKHFHFYWVGGFQKDEVIDHFGKWSDYLNKSKREGLNKYVTFLGFKDNPREYFKAGDLFLLPSREDPFPLVVLEAAECGLPTICFAKAGGMPEFVEEDAGFVVPYEDVDGMAEKVAVLIDNEQLRSRQGARARQKMRSQYAFEHTTPKLFSVCRQVAEQKPMVSVIVPNYNHAKFLSKRLDSIFNQTIRDLEVVLLDDASTDASVEVLEKYRHQAADVRLIINRENSGAPFKQWLKGIDQTRGEIIWIAESDDSCEPEFLEALLPAFRDPAVMLAYANSHVIDAHDKLMGDYLSCDYLTSLSRSKWRTNYQVPGETEINEALGIKNTILNASAVLFRRFDFDDRLRSVLESMRIAGDWFFIVNCIKKGSVFYEAKKLNYHRRHSQSVIGQTLLEKNLKDFFNEVSIVHKYVFENYQIDDGFYHNWHAYLEQQWKDFCPSRPFKELENYYPFAELKELLLKGT